MVVLENLEKFRILLNLGAEMKIKKSDFLLNFMMFCLGATVGRRIGDPYKMRHLAAKSADSMLMNLPHCLNSCFFLPFSSNPGVVGGGVVGPFPWPKLEKLLSDLSISRPPPASEAAAAATRKCKL
jgi:hypothetical protein